MNLPRVDFSHSTTADFYAAFNNFRRRKSTFSPDYIHSAPERIRTLRRNAGFSTFPNPSLPKRQGSTTVDFHCENYRNTLIFYGTVDTALSMVVGERPDPSLRLLQIASSYGPYLAYLRQARGLRQSFGVDNDPFAVRYAAQIGNSVVHGLADRLSFTPGKFDVVISQSFLDRNYLDNVICAPPSFQADVVSQIYRILAPGGVFISFLEFSPGDIIPLLADVMRVLRGFPINQAGFSPPVQFPNDVQKAFEQTSELYIFQKPLAT